MSARNKRTLADLGMASFGVAAGTGMYGHAIATVVFVVIGVALWWMADR